jgi:hypothetical protein
MFLFWGGFEIFGKFLFPWTRNEVPLEIMVYFEEHLTSVTTCVNVANWEVCKGWCSQAGGGDTKR